jgi:hypothetical protein
MSASVKTVVLRRGLCFRLFSPLILDRPSLEVLFGDMFIARITTKNDPLHIASNFIEHVDFPQACFCFKGMLLSLSLAAFSTTKNVSKYGHYN